MTKLIAILIVLLSLTGLSQVASYSYTSSTSVWAANSSPTVITGLGSGINDALSASINIGFNFIYDGTTYTQIKASSNGFITFNTANTLAQPTNNLNTSTDRTLLAVLWDDNQTGSSGNVNYKLTGTSPNRILTVEWFALRWNKSGFTSGTIDCQIKLYETSNKIEYVYNRGAYQSFGNSIGIGASIGLGGSTSGDFLSLSDLVASPTKSTTVETTTIGTSPTNLTLLTAGQANTKIPNGTKFIFGPPPTIITSGNLTAFTTCSGSVSSEKSYNIFGFGLSSDIVITAPTGFELSTTSGGVFTSTLTLTQSSGSVSTTTIYVRLKSTATGSPSGNITNVSTGANTKNMSASGTVTPSTIGGIVSSSQNINSGDSPSDIFLTGNNGSVVKWVSSPDSLFTLTTDISITSTTLLSGNMGPITNDTYYRAISKNGICPQTNSSFVRMKIVYPLPIELLYFKGKQTDEGNLLEWATATETNNNFFTIYKTYYPVNWTEVTKVDGVGTSSFTHFYKYLERVYFNDISYYYLTQTDYDGRVKEFDIIAIDNRKVKPQLIKVTNALGQEIPEEYSGLKFFHYSDGTIIKRF